MAPDGGNFVLAAARALSDSKSTRRDSNKEFWIAAELCIYTNENIILEKIK